MKNRVITISREFGSGGRTIGKKVAEKLGIPCHDAEIIQEMAKETGFAPDYVKEAGEYAPGSFLSSAFSNRMFGPTNEDVLLEHQYKVITELAEKEPCVIVGRCADYILQNKADCLKVFIHADMKFRAALPNSLAIFLGCIAVFFAAPQIGLNYMQMNLVMYLIVGIVSLAGEYSEYLHTILICAIS